MNEVRKEDIVSAIILRSNEMNSLFYKCLACLLILAVAALDQGQSMVSLIAVAFSVIVLIAIVLRCLWLMLTVDSCEDFVSVVPIFMLFMTTWIMVLSAVDIVIDKYHIVDYLALLLNRN